MSPVGCVIFPVSWVVTTHIIFIFTPKIEEMIQFDEHIFQMGWFNHQLINAFMASQPTPLTYPPENKGSIYGLIKGIPMVK